MNTKSFIGALRDEQLGFSLADPWRPTDSAITCVVPIIRADSRKEPDYLVLAKADVKIVDTGSIGGVKITNKSKLPVFIRIGEVFQGDTQERAATFSQLILPEKEEVVQVRCVHKSRPIFAGSDLKSSGYSPNKDSLYLNLSFVGKVSSGMGKVSSGMSSGQGESWVGDVSYYNSARRVAGQDFDIGSMSFFDGVKADDSTSLRDSLIDKFQDLLKEVPLLDNQIGMALIDDKGFHSLDCFNLHSPWKDVKEAIVGKEVLSLAKVDEDSVFVFRPKNAKSIIKKALSNGFSEEEIFSDGPTKTLVLRFQDYIGEAVILNGNLIHLLVTRKKA